MKIVWLTCLLMACAPGVVWRGASPDHDTHAEIMHLRADQWVRIAGKDGPVFDGPVYDGIGAGSLAFSPDGSKIAYAAQRKRAWRVVIQDADLRGKPAEGPAVDGLGDLRWAPDGQRLVYEAERAGKWHMVRHDVGDHHEHWSPPHTALFQDSLRFEGDRPATLGARPAKGEARSGARYAYVASDGACVRVVAVDNNETLGPCFAAIGGLLVTDGVAYTARDADGAHVVVNGDVGPAQEQISALVMAYASVAYIAHRGERAFVVHDGQQIDEADDITGLVMNDDGRLAWVVRVGDRQHLVVNGVRGPARDLVDPPVFGDGFVAHIEKDGATTRVVIGERVVGEHDDAGELVLAPGRWAYVANDTTSAVIVDGAAFPLPALIPGTLQFSVGGEHWGCLSGDPVSRDVMLVIDGKPRRPLDFEALAAHLQARLKQQREANVDAFLRAWVAAELARHVRSTR